MAGRPKTLFRRGHHPSHAKVLADLADILGASYGGQYTLDDVIPADIAGYMCCTKPCDSPQCACNLDNSISKDSWRRHCEEDGRWHTIAIGWRGQPRGDYNPRSPYSFWWAVRDAYEAERGWDCVSGKAEE